MAEMKLILHTVYIYTDKVKDKEFTTIKKVEDSLKKCDLDHNVADRVICSILVPLLSQIKNKRLKFHLGVLSDETAKLLSNRINANSIVDLTRLPMRSFEDSREEQPRASY
jgi:ubiquitin